MHLIAKKGEKVDTSYNFFMLIFQEGDGEIITLHFFWDSHCYFFLSLWFLIVMFDLCNVLLNIINFHHQFRLTGVNGSKHFRQLSVLRFRSKQ